MPIDFNLQELQYAEQYNDDVMGTIEADSLQALPTESFESATATIPTTSSTATAVGDEDDSELIEHSRRSVSIYA